jgi:hypothetical protein
MEKNFSNKHRFIVCGLASVLFFCLTLQTPLMSYGMDGMDCSTQITCAACGCVVNSVSSPLSLSPFFVALDSSNELQFPHIFLTQEPWIRPPR